MGKDNIHSEAGFTVWELLCIIIVIFLLIGLLMPALNRARIQSTRLVCSSYLKGYGMAMQIYLGDNNNKFPDIENGWLYAKESFSADHPSGCRWHDMAMAPNGSIMTNNPQYKGLMWKYFNPNSRNICPQFRSVASSRGCPNPDHVKNISIIPQYSYTMNAYLGSNRSGGVLIDSLVRDPAKVFIFAEENSWTIGPEYSKFRAQRRTIALSTKALDDTMLTISSTDQALDCFATYHEPKSGDYNSGGSNAVFLDGHVYSISVEEQLDNRERGWPERTKGNITYAWAAKTLPVNNPDEK